MKKKVKDIRFLSNYGSVLIGIGTGIVLLLIAAALIALFIQNEYLEITSTAYLPFFVQLVVSFAGAVIAGKGAGELKIVACILTSVCILVLQVCMGILLFDGVSGSVLWGIAGCLIGAGAAILLCKRTNMRPTRRRKRMRSC